MSARVVGSERVAPVGLFARAARVYWLDVFPRVRRELECRRRRAQEIADAALRAQALEALEKRGNMEGAAAFATFVGREHRPAVVRATVAFQTVYNHLDAISEQADVIGPGEVYRLHEALLAAVACPDPSAADRPRAARDAAPEQERSRHGHGEWRGGGGSWESADWRERPTHPPKNDGGYVEELVDACRSALGELPSYAIVAPATRRAAERVVCFQALNRHERDAIERWGRAQTPAGSDLRWWETAASGGSSLGVHTAIAAAAEPALDAARVNALERAYFPWIGALHTLLDHLVDVEEDLRDGQPNLIALYGSRAEAAERMALLAERALTCARALEPGRRHELIVAAMASFYLTAPEAQTGEAAVVSRAVLEVFGGAARPALAVFRARRRVERVAWPGLPVARRKACANSPGQLRASRFAARARQV